MLTFCDLKDEDWKGLLMSLDVSICNGPLFLVWEVVLEHFQRSLSNRFPPALMLVIVWYGLLGLDPNNAGDHAKQM